MTKSIDVVGIGAAIVDILARVDDTFLDQHDVPKGGMLLVDSEKAEAVYNDMGPAREISGGSAGNTIAGLAALGAEVVFVGKTRDDQLGQIFAHDIRAAGAGFETPPFDKSHPNATARSMILVTPDAQRSMCTDLGVSGLLTDADLPFEAIKNSKVLYLEGYMWDRDDTKAAFRSAMAEAKSVDGEVALSLSDPFCVDRHRDSFREIVEGPVDMLFANEVEILSLFETEDFEDAVRQLQGHVPIAALTRSEKGVVVLRNGERVDVPAAPIEELVDTTGAGDLFAAGFLYGHVTGRDLETCGRMGCLAASEIIQHIGARPEQDLKTLFQQNGLIG
ncbi:MAG: adenosine kinase [Pseudomonadota bacterium]